MDKRTRRREINNRLYCYQSRIHDNHCMYGDGLKNNTVYTK